MCRRVLQHRLLPLCRGQTAEAPLSRPLTESGKATLKARLASEVAHIRRVRPEIRIGAVADGATDNWPLLESLSPEDKIQFVHGLIAPRRMGEDADIVVHFEIMAVLFH